MNDTFLKNKLFLVFAIVIAIGYIDLTVKHVRENWT